MNRLTPRRPRLAIAGGLLAVLTATLAATGALRITAKQRIPYRVRYEGEWTIRHYCCPNCVNPQAHPPCDEVDP